jgi:hypothetical protein
MTTSRSDEPRIRVTRTIVYEGRESWVRQTLEHSFIGSSIFHVASGAIYEISRTEIPLPIEDEFLWL